MWLCFYFQAPSMSSHRLALVCSSTKGSSSYQDAEGGDRVSNTSSHPAASLTCPHVAVSPFVKLSSVSLLVFLLALKVIFNNSWSFWGYKAGNDYFYKSFFSIYLLDYIFCLVCYLIFACWVYIYS